MAKTKDKKVRCDICEKIITSPDFRAVIVHKTTFNDRYHHQTMSDCEKNLDVCNACIRNMNFLPLRLKCDKCGSQLNEFDEKHLICDNELCPTAGDGWDRLIDKESRLLDEK